jgi:hypothetical protein
MRQLPREAVDPAFLALEGHPPIALLIGTPLPEQAAIGGSLPVRPEQHDRGFTRYPEVMASDEPLRLPTFEAATRIRPCRKWCGLAATAFT